MKKTAAAFLFLSLCASIFSGKVFAETAQEYYENGFKLMQEKKVDEAIADFKKSAELAPNLPQVYYALGLAYFEKKENVYDAIDAFEHALDLKPDMAEPHYHLGIIYAGLVPDLDRAVDHFNKSIAAAPESEPAYFGLGWLYITQKKDPKAAIEPLEKAAELNPRHAEAQYYLGLSYILNGEAPKALKPISLLKAVGYETLARALEAMTDMDPAIARQRVLNGEGNPGEAGSEAQGSEPVVP